MQLCLTLRLSKKFLGINIQTDSLWSHLLWALSVTAMKFALSFAFYCGLTISCRCVNRYMYIILQVDISKGAQSNEVGSIARVTQQTDPISKPTLVTAESPSMLLCLSSFVSYT